MGQKPAIEIEFREPAKRLDFRHSYAGRGFTAEHTSITSSAEYEFSWDAPIHYIAIHDMILERGEVFVDGQDPIRGHDLRNKITFVPAGYPLTGWAAPVERKNSFTIVNFDPVIMAEELEIAFKESNKEPRFYFEDEPLAATLHKIQHELLTGGTGLYIESLSLVAALEMSRLKSEEMARTTFRRGGLNRSQMNILIEFIEANLSEDVSLDTLAKLVRLSRFHFSRSFKVAFGVSPVKYITARRLDRAKNLLGGPRMGLSEIATTVGFGSVQQFIKVFREEMEITPGEYRRNL